MAYKIARINIAGLVFVGFCEVACVEESKRCVIVGKRSQFLQKGRRKFRPLIKFGPEINFETMEKLYIYDKVRFLVITPCLKNHPLQCWK